MASFTDLYAELQACVLAHLSPADLARVSQTCKALAREEESDLVWCAHFLRRFGLDFWGETVTGPHPYSEVPPEASDDDNQWRDVTPTELFARFSLGESSSTSTSSSRAPDVIGNASEESQAQLGGDDGLSQYQRQKRQEAALCDFAQQNATREGYGGWKRAYRRMHEMVTAWRRPASTAFLVAGLTDFAALSTLADDLYHAADRFRTTTNKGEPNQVSKTEVLCDLTSPSGECRVLRLFYQHDNGWGKLIMDTANICVLRRPRNWHQPIVPKAQDKPRGAGDGDDDDDDDHFERQRRGYNREVRLFRGLDLSLVHHKTQYWPNTLKLVYVVDAERFGDAATTGASLSPYQQHVYRELHGVLGEAKDYFPSPGDNVYGAFGFAMGLLLANDTRGQADLIRKHLRVPKKEEPDHMCPYYAGPVYLAVTSFALGSDHQSDVDVLHRKKEVSRVFSWLSHQPSSRPHWDLEGLLLCTLTDNGLP